MNLYLDASIVVALLTTDIFTERADAYLRTCAPVLIVSDFAGLEFASVIARRVRTGVITAGTARSVFAKFDLWIKRNTESAQTTNADVLAAVRTLRRLDLTLRTADALNITIYQ